jgi:hypothetical protein
MLPEGFLIAKIRLVSPSNRSAAADEQRGAGIGALMDRQDGFWTTNHLGRLYPRRFFGCNQVRASQPLPRS